MMRRINMNRRRFLAAGLGLGLSTLIGPGQVWLALAGQSSASSVGSRLVELIKRKESGRVIGLEYLRNVPGEADAQTLVNLISLDLADDPDQFRDANTAKLREWLRLRMRQDFAQDRVVSKVDPIVKTRRMKFRVRFTPCSFNISCNPLEFVNVR